MGIAYRLDVPRGLTFVVWDGDITVDQIVEHLLGLAADARWPPGRDHLTDLSTVGHGPVPDEHLLELLTEGSRYEGRFRMAVVAREGFAPVDRFVEAAAAIATTVVVFHDVASACAWLGADVATADATLSEVRRELRDSGDVAGDATTAR